MRENNFDQREIHRKWQALMEELQFRVFRALAGGSGAGFQGGEAGARRPVRGCFR